MRRQRPADYFDDRAHAYYERNYEQPRSRHAFNLALRRRACLEMLPATDGLVLDLGCGPGAMTIPLLARGHRVIAIDLADAMVHEVNRRAPDHGELAGALVADAASLPLATGSISTVVTLGLLEYVPDLPAVLREVVRVLAPDGHVIATMTLPRRFERFVGRWLERLQGRTVVNQYIYERAGFDRELEKAGLVIESTRCCAFAPFPLDAVWPRGVAWLDDNLGGLLDQSTLARDAAKTYIVRARRPG